MSSATSTKMAQEHTQSRKSWSGSGQRKEETQADLVFLTFTTLDEQKDANNKKKIRSNAMLHHLRQKKRSRDLTPRATRPIEISNKFKKGLGDCDVIHGRQEDKINEKRYCDCDSLLVGSPLHTKIPKPPDCLPLTAPKYGRKFLDFYSIVLNPDIQAPTSQSSGNPLRKTLVAAVISQEVYFEAMLYMVSTHMDVLWGVPNSSKTLVHRGRSLRLINECLQQQRTNPSDLLIATVFALANYDNVNGQLTESIAHMTAVRMMVSLRGGLQKLGMDGVLAKIILLCDIMGLALGTSQSMFERSEFRLVGLDRDAVGILPIRSSVLNENPTPAEPGIFEKMISILSMVRIVNMQLSTIQRRRWTKKSVPAFLNAGSQLRRAIFSQAAHITDHDRLHPRFHQYECCRIAAQIYVESIFSRLSFSTAANDCYVRELAIALRKAKSPDDWDPIPEASVWTCLVGGAAAKGRPERRWMIAHLGPAMLSLGLLYFEELVTSITLFTDLSSLSSK